MIINIVLFILEILMIYLIINEFITKDFISPKDLTFIEYLKIKFSNLI